MIGRLIFPVLCSVLWATSVYAGSCEDFSNRTALETRSGWHELESNSIRLDTRDVAEPGALTGTVTGGPTRAKLGGATVTADSVSTSTRSNGQFVISPLAAGGYSVTVSASGYEPESRNVSIQAGRTNRLNIHLEETPVQADYPIVVSVTSEYGGAFPVMNGEAVANTYTARVRWNGTPGVVEFKAPNSTERITGRDRDAYIEAAFDMCTAFNDSFNRYGNPLTVTATNGEGMSSAPVTVYPFVFSVPSWSLELSGSNVGVYLGSDGYGFDIAAAFPESPVTAKTTIPDYVPFIGGTFGLQSTQVNLEGSFRSSQYTGSLELWGGSGFKTGEMGEIDVDAGGGVDFSLQDQWYAEGNLFVKIRGMVRGERNVLECVPEPAVQTFALTPVGQWIGDHVLLFAEVSADIRPEVLLELAPELAFKSAEVQLGVGLTAGVEVDAWVGKVRGYAGGKPQVLLHFPADPEWFKRAEIDFVTGVVVSVAVPFVPDLEAEKVWHLVLYDSAARARVAMERFNAARGELDLTAVADGDVLVVTKTLHSEERAVIRGPGETRGANVFVGGVCTGLVQDTRSSVFIENTFSEVEPAVAVQGSANLLVYVHDDLDKDDLQSTEIRYSVRDGGAWTTPVAVTDDTHLDTSPETAFDSNGNAVAVWLRSRSNELTDPNAVAADIELAYSVYDAANGQWSTPEFLTDNAYLDFAPELCRGTDDSLLLVWASNTGNETVGSADKPLQILAREWDAATQTWGAATTVVDPAEGVGVAEFAAAWSGAVGELVYVKDLDGDPTDSSDTELYHVSFDGTDWRAPTRLTDDTGAAVADQAPELIYTSGGAMTLIWLRGSELLMAPDLDVNNAELVRDREKSTGLVGYSLARDSADNLFIIWPDDPGGQADLHYRVYDRAHGVWGEDGKFTDDAPMEKALSAAFTADGHLLLGYARTDIIHETIEVDMGTRELVTIEDVPRDGETDLILHEYEVGCELQITDIFLEPANPAPGSEAEVTVEVTNFGDAAQDNVEVALYDGDPDNDGPRIGTVQTLPTTLTGQGTATTAWIWTIPDTDASHLLTAIVDPADQIGEVVEDNNRAARTVVLADIEVTGLTASWISDDTYELQVTVKNAGVVGSGPFTVNFTSEAIGRAALGSVCVQGLAAGWEDAVQFEWDATGATLPVGIQCEAVAEAGWSELDSENNATMMELWQPTVRGLSAPANLDTVPEIDRITLTWDDVGNGEDGYRILRGDTPDSFVEIGFVAADVLEYVDSSVISGQSYFYAVFAYNGAGAGPRSEMIQTQALPDTDGDNLPDEWEQQIIDADPDDGISTVYDVEPDSDFDGDGAGNLDEFAAGTIPTAPDTDDDGMLDGWEIQYNLDPLTDDSGGDSDGDGFTNLEEFTVGTDPEAADSDAVYNWREAICKLRRIGEALQTYQTDNGADALPPDLTSLVDEGYLTADILLARGDESNGQDPHPYDHDRYSSIYEANVSFFYEFSDEECPWALNWPPEEAPDAPYTWAEAKWLQLENGGDGQHDWGEGYPRSEFPVVRFFWNRDVFSSGNFCAALNLAMDLETVFPSPAQWEIASPGFRTLPVLIEADIGQEIMFPLFIGHEDVDSYFCQLTSSPDQPEVYGELNDPYYAITPGTDIPIEFRLNVQAIRNQTILADASYLIQVQTDIDTDADSLPDDWEIAEFGAVDTYSGTDDPDADGLSNADEHTLGTDPLVADTDNDTIPDGWESEMNLDPNDSGDVDLDEDADGLSNIQEFVLGTDPTRPDSDSDGMDDLWEVNFELKPLDAADKDGDPDGDGATNLKEYQDATNPWVRTIQTGWALISVARECPLPESACILYPAYTWNEGTNSYSALDPDQRGAKLYPGVGYWFYVLDTCGINVFTGVVSQ